MKISKTFGQIAALMDQWAPTFYAEDFDNVGLLVGRKSTPCNKILVTHDVSEEVVDEAIAKKCQLIICFHPIIFSGLKKITGANYVEKTVLKAIENKIGIYATHTALDNHKEGISYILGEAIGLKEQSILIPKKNTLSLLSTYVPVEAKVKVMDALHTAGAGSLGNYSHCSFSHAGEGQFKGNEASNPSLGEKENLTKVEEQHLQLVFKNHLQPKIIAALKEAHPYEEVAYEIIALENLQNDIGLGSIGTLPSALTPEDFLMLLKKELNLAFLRHSETTANKIEKVAVLGGSGSFAIQAAKAQGADALVTADLKYHDFFQAEKEILLVDAGHYETEQGTKKLIVDYLSKKIPNFAITLSEVNTNPVKYF